MYEDYKVYGPYKRKDGREHVCLVKIENGVRIKKTVSYPKFIVENRLGRYLLSEETTDHLDGDITNNSEENLVILSRSENSSKGAKRVEVSIVACKWCGKTFTPTKHQHNARSTTKAGPFCGRKCTGQYGADVQNGGKTLDRDNVDVRYYTINNSYQVEYLV